MKKPRRRAARFIPNGRGSTDEREVAEKRPLLETESPSHRCSFASWLGA